jgi:hypothetical protein
MCFEQTHEKYIEGLDRSKGFWSRYCTFCLYKALIRLLINPISMVVTKIISSYCFLYVSGLFLATHIYISQLVAKCID